MAPGGTHFADEQPVSKKGGIGRIVIIAVIVLLVLSAVGSCFGAGNRPNNNPVKLGEMAGLSTDADISALAQRAVDSGIEIDGKVIKVTDAAPIDSAIVSMNFSEDMTGKQITLNVRYKNPANIPSQITFAALFAQALAALSADCDAVHAVYATANFADSNAYGIMLPTDCWNGWLYKIDYILNQATRYTFKDWAWTLLGDNVAGLPQNKE